MAIDQLAGIPEFSGSSYSNTRRAHSFILPDSDLDSGLLRQTQEMHIMAIQARGHRVAATINPTTSVDLSKISRAGAIPPRSLPDGEHVITLHGARVVQSKTGSVSVILDATTGDSVPIKFRPHLVSSPGGLSDLIVSNLSLLEELAGISDDSPTLADIMDHLPNRTVTVDVIETVDRMGLTVNDIVAVIEPVAP